MQEGTIAGSPTYIAISFPKRKLPSLVEIVAVFLFAGLLFAMANKGAATFSIFKYILFSV